MTSTSRDKQITATGIEHWWSILQNRYIQLILIFVIAVSFRIVLINKLNVNTMAPDATGYHHLATDLSTDFTYTMKGKDYFFREPGYPLFLSVAFTVSNLLGFEQTGLKLDTKVKPYRILNRASEVKVAKYFQAILDAITCLLLFVVLCRVVKRNYAFIITLLFSLYFPYAKYVTDLTRETFQSFLAMLFCLSFMLFLDKKNKAYLILIGVIWGLLNLTFQASLVFLPFIGLFLLISDKHILKAITNTSIIVLVMIVTVSPWLIRTYRAFPSPKILMSFGTSLTPQYLDYYAAIDKALYYHEIKPVDADNLLKTDFRNTSDSAIFVNSWDGEFVTKADSLNALHNESFMSERKLNIYLHYFYNSWFHANPYDLMETPKSMKGYLVLLIKLIILLFNLAAFIGIYVYYKKFMPINIVFTVFMSIWFIVGSEARRMAPAMPFLFLYSLLGIYYLYTRYLLKRIKEPLNSMLINNDAQTVVT